MLPEVVVTNLHRRFTGVSATVRALVPRQRADLPVAVWDWGGLGLGEEIGPAALLRWGWRRPAAGRWRIWHARRDIEILIGLVLRSLLRQPWRVVFTSAAPKRPGWMLRQLIRACDAVVATSPRSAAFLDRCDRVIFHGVDCDWFQPPADRQALLAEVGLTQQRCIACFGRIRPSKGTDLVVEALIAMLPRHPGWVGVITGLCQDRDRAFLEALQARIKASQLDERILFVGDLSPRQIRRWYQRAEICVAASRREGFGLTPLEAMASGCVPVTSGAGAWPWILRADFGVLVETGNLASLIAGLEGLLADPAALQSMQTTARAVAVAEHSIAAEVAALHQLYAELSSSGAPGPP
ncbi:MAG: glycosyltransferase family 4 protein [Synechococcaceae cyanobacterium]|nr:glycosyltransferase family 4 protein [Synechococcaceae cyanobacterium]